MGKFWNYTNSSNKMSPHMLLISLLSSMVLEVWCQSDCSYQKLLKSLNLENASKVRPVRNWKNASIVNIDLTLYTIVDLDMSTQTATTFVWFYMAWTDEYISWNPGDFCGIKKLFVNSDYFWKPDLYIYEMTENDDNSPEIPYYILRNNGQIINAMPLRIISTCNLNIYKFPFDIQTCKLSFGSFMYTVSDIVMWPKSNSSVVNQNAKDVFASKDEWELQSVAVYNTTHKTMGLEYSQVIYSIYIKRVAVIYVLNLIIPACFLVFLDIASMFIHNYENRLDFKITVVLGFSVMLLILNALLPNSDSTPMLGTFCCICMAMMILSVIGTIATSYMTEKSTTNSQVPVWVKVLVLKHLARIILFKKDFAKEELVTPVTADNDPENAKKSETNEDVSDQRRALENDSNVKKEVKLLKRILSEILRIHRKLILDMQQKDEQTEWSLVAQIVDRLVLILYLSIVTLVFIIMICVWTI
ncbi:5-hydroxytryptamine receptor 3A-like isoform X2 [Rana temporaria]|uniref:5-hydroxytryptamine receptor 3A-like isoform X2 n=1 Tax=Rana temporaria TaxID=8407 RepID=UPI001AACC9DC|nr:5-hydroxytryptamine receptor 3A-like isoform X2 [Rana temporaria]